MKRIKQLGFELLETKNVKYFGGSHLKNSNPKEKRPISTKRSMHLVLRSSMARHDYSLLKKDQIIRKIVSAQGRAFGVKVYKQANGGNHLHLIVLPRSRQAFQSFIRAISGLIAREVLGAQRGNPQYIKFWDQRPYTRVLEWGKDFRKVSKYLVQNTLEALGFIDYQPRKQKSRKILSTA